MENSPNVSEAPAPVDVKKPATIKDVLASKDEATAVTKYLEVLQTGVDRESLQTAMAETLNRLGKTDRALEFSLLAAQTRNTEYLGRAAQAFEDGIGKMGEKVQEFHKAVDQMGRAGGRFIEAAQGMSGAASKMSR